MDREETLNKIKYIVHEATEIPFEELHEDAGIMDDLDMSSLEIMLTISDIENEFDINIPEEHVRRFITINDITDYVIENARA